MANLFKSKGLVYFTVLLITAICYIPTINNQWVNWDDDHYVLENPSIQKFSAENLLGLFHPDSRIMDTYMPLPLVTFSLEYAVVKDKPKLYHIDNLILHLINVVLVLWLIFLLCSNMYVAAFVALLFGIHPMHVESVAWITERKDVLMGVFYFLSGIYYLRYLKSKPERKKLFYLLSFIFFVLSVFSKPQAVSLPLVLLLFDWWHNRKFSRKLVFEKLPFFIIAAAIGILSMMIVDPVPIKYGFFERILFSSYALMMYLFKFFIPFGLSVIYDLPEKINGYYPLMVYLSLPVVIAVLALMIYIIRKLRYIFFGMAFFFLTIGLALHFFKLTTSVIYERYTYIPYIGLLFIIAFWFDKYIRTKPKGVKRISIAVLGLVILIFGFLTHKRVQIWQTSETLWTDVIKTQPENYFGYSKRGLFYMSTGAWNKALIDFNLCLELKPEFDEGLNNRGMTHKMLGYPDKAFDDFSKAIKLNGNLTPALVNMGILLKDYEDYPLAIEYFNKAIIQENDNPEYYIHRGVVYKRMGYFKEAKMDYSRAIQLNPGVPSYYYNRGHVFCLEGEFRKGIDDFSSAIQLRPDYALAWFDRSLAYYNLSDFAQALNDAYQALEYGFQVEDSYMLDLKNKSGK